MITSITTLGKYHLFKSGWTTRANRIKLYTDNGTLVDTKTVTFTYASNNLSLSASAVFDVGAGTNDVSYVSLIYNDGSNDVVLYNRSLGVLYDYPTAGTFTVNTWAFSISAPTSLLMDRESLFKYGWEIMDALDFYKTDVVVSGTGFEGQLSTNISTGELVCAVNPIVNISAGNTGINRIRFGYLGSLSNMTPYYSEALPSSYSFTNAGTLTVENLKFTLA